MIPPEMFPAFDKALIDGGDVSMEFGLDLWRVELEVWARVRLNTGAEVIQAEASGPTAHEAYLAAYAELAKELKARFPPPPGLEHLLP
jgi:hypothetical protein